MGNPVGLIAAKGNMRRARKAAAEMINQNHGSSSASRGPFLDAWMFGHCNKIHVLSKTRTGLEGAATRGASTACADIRSGDRDSRVHGSLIILSDDTVTVRLGCR
jgi:hypothetical protein